MAATMIHARIVPRARSTLRRSTGRKALVVRANSTAASPTYLQFAEKVNGRAAQQGFIWGAVNEAYTGNNVMEQLVHRSADGTYEFISGDVLNAVLVIAAVTLGTAITTVVPNRELEEQARALAPQFTDDAELLNGRLAMLGFVALAATSAM